MDDTYEILVDRIEKKIHGLLVIIRELQEKSDILQQENIRLENKNKLLLKEVADLASTKGHEYKESLRSNYIDIETLKSELDECIKEVNNCIEISTKTR